MRKKYSLVVLVGMVVCLTTSMALAQAPSWDIPPSALSGGALGSQYVRQIDDHLQYWADRMVNAKTPEEVAEARNGILSAYKAFDSTDFQYAFASEASKILVPVLNDRLKEDDRLQALKLVNVSLALSKMPQVTAQDALEAMVRHPNPAVRFAGWRGYKGARTVIMSQGTQYSAKMFQSLAESAASEKSAVVIGGIFVNLDVPSFVAASVPEDTVRQAQKRSYEILQANWRMWCQRVRMGDLEMTRAMLKGVDTLGKLAAAAGDQVPKAQSIQMVADLMRATSLAYDDTGATGPVADEDEDLLRKCELLIKTLSAKPDKEYLALAFYEEIDASRCAAVPAAVLEWISELKDFNITKTDFPATVETSDLQSSEQPEE
jgi:hypothetical protein